MSEGWCARLATASQADSQRQENRRRHAGKVFLEEIPDAFGRVVSGDVVVLFRFDPVALGLKPHLRINREAARKQAAERFALWDREVGLSQSWNELKAERRQAVLAAAQADAEAGIEPGVEAGPILFEATTGQKFGLTVLVDFSDDVATVCG